MTAMNWLCRARRIEEDLTTVFYHLHQYPELSGRELRTSEFIAQRLTALQLELERYEDYPGVVGYLPGPSGCPTIAIRCDMDALPVTESSASPAPSTIAGIMHACGHDLHMTACLGAAQLLAAVKSQLPFGIRFIFQPAEETNEGAKALLERGVLKKPPIGFIIGLHANPELTVGEVGLVSGPVMSAESSFTIDIRGVSSHGAEPHKGKDAILAGAAVVVALQSIVSRQLDPRDAAVVSVGTFAGGGAKNLISSGVTLSGTVRCFRKETENTIRQRLQQVVKYSAAVYGCSGHVEYLAEQPPVVNDPTIVEVIYSELVAGLGADRVMSCRPSMVSEDFSYYLQEAPGVFLWVGTTGVRDRKSVV